MILLRHGESEFNRHFGLYGEDLGMADPPLTALGRRQANAAAAALAAENITRVICSPYTRALESAAPVAHALGLRVEVHAQVRERYCASCDIGSPRSVLADAWPEPDFGDLGEIWWPDSEESRQELAERAVAFRASLEADPEYEHTLVVCHWGFIMAVTSRNLGNGQWLRCARSAWAAKAGRI
jgi:glucosyl-3-phosphoglycerate phosphatase